MKQICTYICIFYCLFLNGELQPSLQGDIQPLHIYLCSRLTEKAKQWNNAVTQNLDNEFHIFRPQDIDVSDIPATALDSVIYAADLEGMVQSDLLLVLPPYGRDCAWEIGWFCGHNKPTIAYAELYEDWLRDAMVKGGLTAIVTSNETLFHLLLQDPAIKNKSYLISSQAHLADAIKNIYNQAK